MVLGVYGQHLPGSRERHGEGIVANSQDAASVSNNIASSTDNTASVSHCMASTIADSISHSTTSATNNIVPSAHDERPIFIKGNDILNSMVNAFMNTSIVDHPVLDVQCILPNGVQEMGLGWDFLLIVWHLA